MRFLDVKTDYAFKWVFGSGRLPDWIRIPQQTYRRQRKSRMLTITKPLAMTTIVLSLMLTQLAYAGFDEGLAAYQKGDYQTALKEWKPLANQGDAQSQFKLGLIYHRGKGVKQDYTKACSWYLKAAEQGHILAQSILGAMYSEGKGVEQNFKKSLFWYTKSATQGHAFSQEKLGIIYSQGIGVVQDYNQASEWYLKAAEQGYTVAQSALGIMYYEGRGIEKNYVAAHMWLNIASANATSDLVKDEDFQDLINQAPQAKETIKQDQVVLVKLIRQIRDQIAQLMTPEQLETAQILAKKWMLEHNI